MQWYLHFDLLRSPKEACTFMNQFYTLRFLLNSTTHAYYHNIQSGFWERTPPLTLKQFSARWRWVFLLDDCYKIGCQVILVRIDIRILISTRRGANVCGSALGCCGVMRRRSMSVFGVNMKIVVGVYGVRRHHSETTILFVGGKTRRECCSFFFVVVDPDSNRAIKMVVGWHSSRVRTHLFAICIGTLALSHPVFIKEITYAIKIIYSW